MARDYRHLQVSFAGGEMSPEMWNRHDDARFRSGAARLRNMIAHSRGSVARRPGFGFVREVKDSTRAVRLLPFRYSNDQTYAIEMGRAEVDGRDIGYFRFHTGGGTLLQLRPDDYQEPVTVSDINLTTEEWTTGAHTFQLGDPIVFTMEAQSATDTVTFDTATNEVIYTPGTHGFIVNESIMFRTSGALPAGLVAGRIYYALPTSSTRFQVIDTRGSSQVIPFTDAGTGTHKVACLPNALRGASLTNLSVNTVYYAIPVDSTHLKIAYTRAEAMAGTALNYSSIGTADQNDIRIHHNYQNGSVVFDTVNGSPFYCRKPPAGATGSRILYLNNHLGHATTIPEYWVRQPGSSSVVTFDLATEEVIWTTHGLTAGDPITFSTTGALPTEIIAGTVYYVREVNGTDRFKVSDSVTGPTKTLSGIPAGTHTAFANGIYEVPHHYAEQDLFEVNFAQSGDIITLVHRDRPVSELRRLGPTHWVLVGVTFNASVSAPGGVEVSTFGGEGHKVTGVTVGPPSVLTTIDTHGLVVGDPVMVESVGTLTDGVYVVKVAAAVNSLELKFVEAGTAANSTNTTVVAASRVRFAGFSSDQDETYAVTALDAKGEESPASAQIVATNNLLVSGAYNTVIWDAIANATRYRVYKAVNGLLGFIGEVDAPTTTFQDDNIGPDLAISPPILDGSLLRLAFVTFNHLEDLVLWTGHGLPAGTPIVFETDGTLPAGLDHLATYYVFDPSADAFQLVANPDDIVSVDMTDAGSGVHLALTGAWPSSVCYFEQRRVFGGTRLFPQDFWLTASGTESDLSYTIPTQDSDRIQNRLAARERSEIRHAMPVGNLLLLTSAAEYRITPLNDDALTPGSVSARAPTHVGVSRATPVTVNNSVLFPSARGGHIRELGFLDTIGDYVTADVSLRASHLFDERTIVQMAYQQAPHPIVWVVSSVGTLLGFTYVPEEQIAGWHEHDIGGLIESVVAVAEGDEDRVYVVTNRGGTRYIERMGSQNAVTNIEDAFFVDLGATYSGTPVSSIFVPHLADQAVVFLADGVSGSGTVSAGGTLTLTAPASTIQVGLAYSHELHTLPLGMQVDAALGSGRTKNINQVWLRVRSSGRFSAGPSLASLVSAQIPASGVLQTGLVQVVIPGQWDLEGQVYVQGSSPLPLIIAGLTLEVATGGS